MSRRGTKTITVPEADHSVISELADECGLGISDFVLALCKECFPTSFPDEAHA